MVMIIAEAGTGDWFTRTLSLLMSMTTALGIVTLAKLTVPVVPMAVRRILLPANVALVKVAFV